METVAEYDNLKIPTWALSYLVNADDSGITEEDKKLVDDFEDEPYFSWSPKFGLGCDVQECTILIVK